MKVTALLTGRGNNTLKDKNVLDILGKPVLYYPANAGNCSKYVTAKYCSKPVRVFGSLVRKVRRFLM